MDYKKYILETLIEKYNRSNHFKGSAITNRKVVMYFNENEFPEYDVENSDLKGEIHYIVDRLKEKGLVEYEWLKGQKGNIIDRVYLVLDNISEVHAEAGIKLKKAILDELLFDISELRNELSIEWINMFLDYSTEEIVIRKKYPKYIPKEKEQQILLFAAFKGIQDKGTEELLERIFSRRYLGNSKDFENNIRSKLVPIVRDFMLQGEDIEDKELLQEAVLQQIGIIKSSEELLFYGSISIILNNTILDFDNFIYGSSMNTNMIKNFNVRFINFKKLITIENKASYLAYISKMPKDELVVYLGGFYSPVKRLFLEKIYKFTDLFNLPVEFYHWGDIDYGGFCIFEKLKSQVIRDLQPLNMDIETLSNHIKFCDKIDNDYKCKLKSLLLRDEYLVFHNLIQFMVQKGIKLEQEAFTF